MLTLDEIADRLKDVRPEVVAADTGLSISTVLKYRDGRATSPPLDTVVKLSDYLSDEARTLEDAAP